MTRIDHMYETLAPSFFFTKIGERTDAFRAEHPGQRVLLLGIGDVTRPLAPVVIEAMHRAVDEQSRAETFHGYLLEGGAPFFRAAVASYYARWNVHLRTDEIFVSSGAADDLGSIGNLFTAENRVLVIEPAYPAYVDTNQMAGRPIFSLPGTQENGFLPLPKPDLDADIVYLCSPNNPTGATYTRPQLKQWVDWANDRQAVIIFDAAYESYIQDAEIPHSIYEIEGAKQCAIEICSLSKTAGFTGTRTGYTVVPADLIREGSSLRDMWERDRTTRTNGVSYILQRGAEAALSEEGTRQNQENIRVYRENGRILSETLKKCGLWFTGGRNAPYLWLRCPDGLDGWTFFDRLLKETGIVGTPGEGFGKCGAGYFRLSCFGSREDTEEAALRLLRLFGKRV